jgi:hypothetical protein
MQNIELQNWVGSIQYVVGHQHKYFFSTPSHLGIPKVANYKYQKTIAACVHPLHYWAQHQEQLLMDERNSHD